MVHGPLCKSVTRVASKNNSLKGCTMNIDKQSRAFLTFFLTMVIICPSVIADSGVITLAGDPLAIGIATPTVIEIVINATVIDTANVDSGTHIVIKHDSVLDIAFNHDDASTPTSYKLINATINYVQIGLTGGVAWFENISYLTMPPKSVWTVVRYLHNGVAAPGPGVPVAWAASSDHRPAGQILTPTGSGGNNVLRPPGQTTFVDASGATDYTLFLPQAGLTYAGFESRIVNIGSSGSFTLAAHLLSPASLNGVIRGSIILTPGQSITVVAASANAEFWVVADYKLAISQESIFADSFELGNTSTWR